MTFRVRLEAEFVVKLPDDCPNPEDFVEGLGGELIKISEHARDYMAQDFQIISVKREEAC